MTEPITTEAQAMVASDPIVAEATTGPASSVSQPSSDSSHSMRACSMKVR